MWGYCVDPDAPHKDLFRHRSQGYSGPPPRRLQQSPFSIASFLYAKRLQMQYSPDRRGHESNHVNLTLGQSCDLRKAKSDNPDKVKSDKIQSSAMRRLGPGQRGLPRKAAPSSRQQELALRFHIFLEGSRPTAQADT